LPALTEQVGVARQLRVATRLLRLNLWFCRVLFCCTRTMGASRHPAFPAPSSFDEGGVKRKTRTHRAARTWSDVSPASPPRKRARRARPGTQPVGGDLGPRMPLYARRAWSGGRPAVRWPH